MKYWFIFNKQDLLLEKLPDGTYTIPLAEEPPVGYGDEARVHNIAPLDGVEVKAFYMEEPIQAEGNGRYEMCGLRQSFYKLPSDLYLKAGKCEEILYWDSNNNYCGRCGGRMLMHTDISKKCTHCGREIWPQLNTAIIVLISRGDEVLLVRANNFRGNFFGLIAGFVETGETLEEAVVREVKEETGLRIRNIRYFASQPWPYPCGLMCGFYADYDGGEIKLQLSELNSGGWFRYDNLPTIPEKLSIARRLIDNWLAAKQAAGQGGE